MNKLKVASFFCGVGGIDLAFINNGCDIVYANDIDKYACETYNLNFKVKAIQDDIYNIKQEDLPQCDIVVGGFPCQPFSIAGYQKGFDDDRGVLFFRLANIISFLKPKCVFLENVKNLVSHNQGKTIEAICKCLEKMGYYVDFKIMNASVYGNIPQNRERVYFVAFSDYNSFNRFKFPEKIDLKNKIETFIDFDNKVDEKYYYSKFIKISEEFDKVPISNKIYQWRRHYIRENKSNVCPTLTANMGCGGHNVPLIKTKYGLRKLTPRECFNLQGFPDTYKLPSTISDNRLYKQAGNSVCVKVIDRICTNIIFALQK